MEFNKCLVCGNTYNKDEKNCTFCLESSDFSENCAGKNLSFDNYLSIVILGGGFSGYECAQRIRNMNKFCKITIISPSELPYNKVKMHKAQTITNFNDFLLLSGDEISSLEIEKVTDEVLEINRLDKMLKLKSGNYLCYDKLILATGYEYSFKQTSLMDIIPYDNKNNIENILRLCVYNDTALIYGSDILCLSAYNLLKESIKNIFIVSPKKLIGENYAGYDLSAKITQHISCGATLYTDTEIAEICGDKITLSNGEKITSSIIVDTTKGTPSTYLAQDATILCNDGISVTEYMETNDPNVFALGGCTNTYSVSDIRRQAQVIAYKLLGKNKKYSPSITIRTVHLNNDSYCIFGDISDCTEAYSHKLNNTSKTIYVKDNILKGFCFKNSFSKIQNAVLKTGSYISQNEIIELIN